VRRVINYEYDEIINDALKEMAYEERKYFSPHYVSTRTGIADLKYVTEHLLSLAASGKILFVNYEIECPEGDSDFSVNKLEDLVFEPRICHVCGVEYIPDLDRIWVTFDFYPDYVDFIKKKEKRILTML
jgi:hypothetical protein